MSAFWLQIQYLFYAFFRKDMVTATNSLIKIETPEQLAQPGKGNIGIRSPTQYEVYLIV